VAPGFSGTSTPNVWRLRAGKQTAQASDIDWLCHLALVNQIGFCTYFFGGQKPEYLLHYTVCLLGLKQKLGMRGTVEDNQLFGFRSLVKPGADAG
jgi:hypothetical protein